MAKTIRSYTSDGAQVLYPIDFVNGFIKREYVYVYLDTDAYTTQIAYTWVNDSQIQLTAPVANTLQFHIRRVIPRDTKVNDYNDGSIFKESNIDDSYDQSLMILEEVEDGYVTGPSTIIGDLIQVGQGASFVQEARPTDPVIDGIRWYKPSEATTYVWYMDDDSGQWVEENPSVVDAPNRIIPFDTVAEATADTSLAEGDTIQIAERGNGIFDVISGTGTANTWNIIAHGSLSLSLELKVEYPINPNTFGVTKDGVDSSGAAQAVIDFVQVAGGSIEFSEPGDYELRGILVDGPASEIPEIGEWTKITSVEGAVLKNTAADGSNMFTISSISNTNFLKLHLASVQMAAGGGHIIDLQGTLNHSQINIELADQNEPSKSIINHNDTGFFFNKVRGLYWAATATHSVPSINMSSTTNKISANEFDILRPDRSGTVPFMVIDCTDASDFNFSNQIRLTNPERCDGGVLRISGAAGTVIHPMTCFDNGTITNHIIEIGVPTFDCKNTTIYNYQRNAGTLDSGIKDILLTDANNTVMISPSGTSAGQVIEIDLGLEPTVDIIGGKWFEAINWPQLTNEVTIASGAITIPEPYSPTGVVTYIRVDGEGDADDTLSTINGGFDGMVIVVQSESAARDITLDAAGNISPYGNMPFTLGRVQDSITLMFNAEDSSWTELSRSLNTLGGVLTSGITADVGSSQGGGPLTTRYNEISTCANTGDAVTLPTAIATTKVTIINNGVNACDVFPATGDNLGAGVNNAASLAAGVNITYFAYDATNWESI